MRWVCAVFVFLSMIGEYADAYPIDGGSETGIRRLERDKIRNQGKHKSLPEGALLGTSQIMLRMQQEGQSYELNETVPKDEVLQKGLQKILKTHDFKSYAIALLDITDPASPKFAAVDEMREQTPGSTAKILVAAALFDQLKKLFPDDIEMRKKYLRTIKVSADDWSQPDEHEVPISLDEENKKWVIRVLKPGDTFNLWEWLDHALSASANGAASTLWREATLMALMQNEYPPKKYDKLLFNQFPVKLFSKTAFEVIDAPLYQASLTTQDFKLRKFFTRGSGRYVRAESSNTSPLGMLRWMLKMEQGKIVDEFSSLEIKKLLYTTRRRIRYAASHELNRSAVYFKSGSLYGCNPGRACKEYEGDRVNILNSLALVETKRLNAAKECLAESAENMCNEEIKPVVYMVAVMSNELKRNASYDHAVLASKLHQLLMAQ